MKKTMFAAAFALVASANAAAATVENTWYGKASYGPTDLDIDEFEQALCDEGVCYDFDTDKGFGFDLGYRLNRYFAIEAGYRDLGEAKDTISDVTVSFSTASWNMAALATTDASRELYAGAKLGYHFWESELDISAPGLGSENLLNEDGTDIFYGVFANWRSGKWVLGIDHTIFQTEIGGEGFDPSMTSVSLSMDF